MRTLMKIQMPVQAANRALTPGAMPQPMQALLSSLKPEAAYFYPEQGVRTAIIVFDLKSPSDMPSIAEPFFRQFDAKVEFSPVMNLEDLQAGLQKVQASLAHQA